MMLEGKVAVVSGLGPGMGRDISLALAREGADIVMAARREKRMARVAPEIEALGRRSLSVVCDITDAEACANLASEAEATFGHVDIVVNNAFANGNDKSFVDSDLDEWRATFDVNFFGSLQLTKALIPLLTAQDDSRVIMINTMSMQMIDANFGAYAASKAALASATKTLARELGRDGVRVNGIHPGYIWGPSVEWYFNQLAEQRGVDFQEVYDEVAADTCLGYLPSSAEIAGAVVFFASPLSRAVTGQALSVNAGHYFSGP
jgi:NAD(P)-dependent dehydrogenase (short-subunit alcohol dehydrogenase family)